MIELLRQTDHSLFHLINTEWANSVFDAVLPHLRADKILASCYLIILVVAYQWYPKQFWMIALVGGLTFLLTDQLSGSVIKHYVRRIRPCNNPVMEARLIVDHCGSGFSFVSSHAANVFGLATLLVMIAKNKRLTALIAFTWAALVSFSQVYVGVHFPADVVGGAMLGIIIATITGYGCNRFIIKSNS